MTTSMLNAKLLPTAPSAAVVVVGVVVVLPVPPFWLTMAIVVAFFEIFITSASLSRGW